MANEKPSMISRMFQGMMQGGGKAGLLGDPLFQVGMGLLAKGQDNRIPYATAVMGGLQNAQTAQDQSTQRQLLQEQARQAKQQQELYEQNVRRLFPNTPGDMAAQPVPSQVAPGMEMQMMGPPTPPTPNPIAGALLANPQAGSTALIDGLLGQQFGTADGKGPSAVQEFNFFKTLTPEQQANYLNVKRAPQTVEFGGVNMRVNPITNQIEAPGGMSPNEYFDQQLKLEGKRAMQSNEMVVVLEDMKQKGAALRELPIVEIDVREAVRVIDQLRVHPGLEDAVGNYFVESYANTEGRDFINKLDGLRGRNFLQAIEALKGAGTITDIEGAKAEAALQSLATSQTEAGFRESLDELERALKVGIDQKRIKAGLEAYYIDPETGELREEGDTGGL